MRVFGVISSTRTLSPISTEPKQLASEHELNYSTQLMFRLRCWSVVFSVITFQTLRSFDHGLAAVAVF